MKSLATSIVVLSTVTLLSLSAAPVVAGPIDDFLCYKAKDERPPQTPGLQLLEDPLFEAGQIPFLVKKAKEYCTAASKEDTALINSDIQLKRYRIKRSDGIKHEPQTVTVGDQFTEQFVGSKLVVITKKARDLMVPTAHSVCDPGSPQNAGRLCTRNKECGGDDFCKGDPPKCSGNAPVNPGGACTTEEDCGGDTYCPPPVAPDPESHDVDHFKCYRIKVDKVAGPAFPRGIVTPVYDLFDSTGTRQVPVKKPFELCNPVDKNGEGIKDPDRRLLCYKVKPVTDQKKALVVNQFGIEELDLRREKLLCVPASPSGAFLEVTSGVLD
jgi:hypothetical protein